METRSQPKSRRAVIWGFIAVFFVLLWLPMVDSLFGLDDSPLNENRAPVPFPKFEPDAKPLHDYFSSLDAYYSDHFGFRNRLIRLNNRWKKKWFKESSVDYAMIGTDGWLYFAGNDMAGHFRGLRGFRTDDLKKLQNAFESRRDWLAGRGIKYLVIIPPDKHTIYPEHLPEWLTRTGPHDKLDQLIAHMKANSTVEILDMRTALREGKSTTPTYYSTDSHWNLYGGFLGYQAIMRALKRQIPEINDPLPLAAFEMKTVPGPGMDLAMMLGQEKSYQERNDVKLLPKSPLTLAETLVDPSILAGKRAPDKVPMYSENPAGNYKLVMFRDSFGKNLFPYLSHDFRRAVYISQREIDVGLIDRERPDVVIDEIVERRINQLDINDLKENVPAD